MVGKFLSGNNNIYNEAHYVASNIPIFFDSCCQPPLVARERFSDREGTEKIKYKFRFAPKFPSICINQKCLVRVESVRIL